MSQPGHQRTVHIRLLLQTHHDQLGPRQVIECHPRIFKGSQSHNADQHSLHPFWGKGWGWGSLLHSNLAWLLSLLDFSAFSFISFASSCSSCFLFSPRIRSASASTETPQNATSLQISHCTSI